MFKIFPFNFIFWESVTEHSQIKQKYLNLIEKTKSNLHKNNSWKCDVVSSFRNTEINDYVFDSFFMDTVVWKYFDEFLKNKPFDFEVPKNSFILNIWYNFYNPGQYQEIHNHTGRGSDLLILSEPKNESYHGLFSGIYILDSQETNKTVFYQPGPNPCTRKNEIKLFTDDIPEGSVIFFPSGLLHYTMPAEKSRTIVSFNITSSFD